MPVLNLGYQQVALRANTVLGLGAPQPSEKVFSALFKDGASAVVTSDSLQEVLPWEIFNIGESLPSHQTEAIKLLLQEFQPCIALSPSELGCTHLASHSTDTGYHAPLRQHSCRVSQYERCLIADKVSPMLANDIIAATTSLWASPIVLVTKKDGTIWFCVE